MVVPRVRYCLLREGGRSGSVRQKKDGSNTGEGIDVVLGELREKTVERNRYYLEMDPYGALPYPAM